MEKVRDISFKAASIISVISIVGYTVIALLTLLDVLMTKLLNAPIFGAYEIVERLMLCAVFASFAYAQTKKAHINMPILIEHLPRKLRLLSLFLTSIASIGIAIYMGYAAYQQGMGSLHTGTMTGMLHIPLYPFYFVESLAMIFFAIILLIDTYFILVAMWNDDYNVQINLDYGINTVKN
jgi:TRAP-type C4-dicarboxylate transport system permease small subunit